MLNINPEKNFINLISRLAVLGFLLLVVGCAATPVRQPVPPELISQVMIDGIPDARLWGDDWPRFYLERFETFSDADLRRDLPSLYQKPHNFLAISGGGPNGAFGAGLLVGWTSSGTRPEFNIVTGISTGALTAPFAFLGPGYDDELKKVYTTTSTKNILKRRGIFSAIFGDSLSDTTPLKKTIAKYITTDIVKAIAREHLRGRRLYVGTVNLDAGRSVIWDIGAISASDSPRKMELIHDILLASSAIPVAFPPVAFTVTSDGVSYDELHVDGGMGSQVFVYPASLNWRQFIKKLKVQGAPRVYVIRNSLIEPNYREINQKVLPIAIRSIDVLIKTQAIGDLYQIYALCQRDGNDFNLAYIPSEFTKKPTEEFDPVYMKKLYEYGYRMALGGYPWKKAPPDFSNQE